MDHKKERNNDVDRIKQSVHPRKIVVAGPGTGKSYLFRELINKRKEEGKSRFLAITFIGKLRDALADDLCGLARTTTIHSFARSLVLEHVKNWTYYPKIYKLISEDLQAEGIGAFEIGDTRYVQKTKWYRAIGDQDVIYYAVQICKRDPNKIPVYDLLLVDEYQDFNEKESELVDLLALKNEIVIVGDDDQALYAFKGSSPSFIRGKYDVNNKDWESLTLRFCSRCTEAMIKYFHSLVAHFNLNNTHETDVARKRIEKEYVCYLTGKGDGKDDDSKANPKIHLIKNCPVGMIAYKIKNELDNLVRAQKIKEVLVIAEGQRCLALLNTIAPQLRNYGFKNVDYRNVEDSLQIRQDIVDAYKFIAKDESSALGWRILGNPPKADKERHLKNSKTLAILINSTPSKLKTVSRNSIAALEAEIEDWVSPEGNTDPVADESVGGPSASERHRQNERIRKAVLIHELKRTNIHLDRPLCNLEITVCSILRSKGLSADVVFLVGFDQGKFPAKKDASEEEVYQMLVAITRARKTLYLINTIKSKVSGFIECLDSTDVDVKE